MCRLPMTSVVATCLVRSQLTQKTHFIFLWNAKNVSFTMQIAVILGSHKIQSHFIDCVDESTSSAASCPSKRKSFLT